MSSMICQNFVQNAWKKELCSNCFKSKSEHAENKLKPLPRITRKLESIIKNGKKKKMSRSVRFPNQLTEVIGYGGEDWFSDTDDESDSNTIEEESIPEIVDEEHDKELQKLTKANTDFNTTALAHVVEVKKSFTHLQLGKPIVDSDGKKKTLLVSVKPFGEDNSALPKKIQKPVSQLSKNSKEKLTTTKPNVVLTSYTKNDEESIEKEEKSLLDEISETLENSKNPIQIISRKKTQKEITLSVPSKESNKENEKQNENEEQMEISKGHFERRNCLTRTPALKREHGKPTIYQMAAKIELLNNKNNQLTKEHVNDVLKLDEEKELRDGKSINDSVSKATGALVSADLIKEEIINNCKTEIYKKCKENDLKTDNSIECSASPKYTSMLFANQSREQAGEPDGRADPDTTNEPPALPLSPPPFLESHTSFLHCTPPVLHPKPKLPTKPSTVAIKKINVPVPHIESKTQVMTTFLNEPKCSEQKNVLEDTNDLLDTLPPMNNKRRAPKPPEESGCPIYVRNSIGPINVDCPVQREKDKRERASSCSPNLPLSVCKNPHGEYEGIPEPAPRKSLSASTDSLASYCGDEKKKEKSKGRFSLKKFLRMGSNKDLTKINGSEGTKYEDVPTAPQPKPRLVIVHPSDLNGEQVEVVYTPLILDQVDAPTTPFPQHPSELPSEYEVLPAKAAKPPPPPRNLEENAFRPSSLPPKSAEMVNKSKQISRNNSLVRKKETVYANIGEVRSSITPNKPVRTASMREREAQQQQKQTTDNYEPINICKQAVNENVYDYINNSGRSSSPDSDSSREKRSPKVKTGRLNKKCGSSIDVSGDYFKFNNIPRSMSLTYCGSETESEIYSPYSFYGSESEVTEDDHDWIQNGRTHKLRSRKGRSIVHKNLEDNYGAVVVANHEALAQVLENIQQIVHFQPALRALKTLSNLGWMDFEVQSALPVIIGERYFYQALWGTHHVTLSINVGLSPSSTLPLGTFNLTPVTEFSDLIPAKYLNLSDKDENKQVQATITVLPWLQVNTITSFSLALKAKTIQVLEETWKDALFMLLQLVNALKTLQAQGIEELPLSLNYFVLCKEMEKETHQKLYVLQSLSEELTHKDDEENFCTLCMCALRVLEELQPATKITSLLQSLLNNERAVSLTQVKSVLEFSLWGPSDVALGSTIREREMALQRWLDLQRATVLHGLVCTRVQLTVFEEYHLLFLVRSNARSMCDASLLLESSNMKHVLLNGHK